jgi:hypothetical protein
VDRDQGAQALSQMHLRRKEKRRETRRNKSGERVSRGFSKSKKQKRGLLYMGKWEMQTQQKKQGEMQKGKDAENRQSDRHYGSS